MQQWKKICHQHQEVQLFSTFLQWAALTYESIGLCATLRRSVCNIADVCVQQCRGLCASLQRSVRTILEVCVQHCKGLCTTMQRSVCIIAEACAIHVQCTHLSFVDCAALKQNVHLHTHAHNQAHPPTHTPSTFKSVRRRQLTQSQLKHRHRHNLHNPS